MSFWSKIRGLFGGKSTPEAPAPPAAPPEPAAPPPVAPTPGVPPLVLTVAPTVIASAVAGTPVPPPPPVVAPVAVTADASVLGTPEDRYRADEILGLSMADLRKRALKIDPYRTPWIGRVDTIPPQTDERTALIDRGLILRGMLSKAQLDEIHRIGDIWIRHHESVRFAAAAAHSSADAAVAAETARRIAAKVEKRRVAAEREVARRAAIDQRRATDIIFAGHGVSARLHDRRTHVEELTRLGLPVLASPADLAGALGVTVPQLRWLAYHSEATPTTHYVYFEVPKRSGGTRLLASPHAKLAAAQRWVLDSIVSKLELTTFAHGFVPGRSTVTNARCHVGKHVVVNLDLADFFPTITFPRIRGLFESIGYSPAVATLLALLVTESPRVAVQHDGRTLWVAAGDRALPQGACTSPALSNLVSRKLDRRLAGASKKLGWTYTRYADDLAFSGDREAATKLSLLFARVRHIVREEGFVINEAKGRVQRAARRQSVTGIVVNDKLSAPRDQIRRIRAILHAAKTQGLAAQNRDRHDDFTAWLQGTIAYISMIDPVKGGALKASFDALPK